MGFTFNLDEVMAMAEEIERNGARFYRRAAAVAPDDATRELLSELAGWEQMHEALFQRMRAELVLDPEAAGTVHDPMDEAELYLQAMAEQHVFRRDLDVETMVDQAGSSRAILELALEFERDTILFFLGMKRVVPAQLGRDKVDRLVDEEMGHVVYLRRAMARLETA